MNVTAIKTEIFTPKQNIESFLIENLQGKIKERHILCLTSKIISLAENMLVPKKEISKRDLIKREADVFLAETIFEVALTIKHGIMIPSAGIDESNSASDHYILYPENPFKTAESLWRKLKTHFKLKEFGLILTDSHTQPLRRGVTGVALSYWGFKGVRDLQGKEDLFGRKLKYTSVHIADALSAAAVLLMGEANESRPLALITDADVIYADVIDPKEGMIEPEQDLYFCLYKK